MKRYHAFSILLIVLATMASCEKVIDVDLNESDPALVTEALLVANQTEHTVRLSHSVNFDEENEFPGVSGALVTLGDDAGNTAILSETSPGVYVTSTFQAVPGRTYSLYINDNGEEYESKSYLHFPVAIDTMFADSFAYSGNAKFMRVRFTDRAGVANYYRIVEIINGDTLETINLTSDQFNDGMQLSADIFSDMNPPLNAGDTVEMLLQTIDEGAFNYLRELVEVINRAGLSASPANPRSNISGGSLGYFSPYSETSAVVVVP